MLPLRSCKFVRTQSHGQVLRRFIDAVIEGRRRKAAQQLAIFLEHHLGVCVNQKNSACSVKIVTKEKDAQDLSIGKVQPMETLMNLRSLPFKLTAEDRPTIEEWRWSLAAVYGSILLLLVLIVAAAPYTKTDSASGRIDSGVASAATRTE